MMNQEVGILKNQGLLSLYKSAWINLIQNWRVLLISHGINFLLVFIAMGPLSTVIKSATESSAYHDKVAGPFSYTLLMDILNNHGEAVRSSLVLISSIVIPFLLWSVFSAGGFMRLILAHHKKVSLSEFWKGGAEYFFRFLRLSLYTLLAIVIIGAICIVILSSGGLNPLQLVSENALIKKTYLILGVFFLFYFFISLLKEVSKAKISNSTHHLISKPILSAAKKSLKPRTILLAIINLLILILVGLIYLGLKQLIGDYFLPALITSQLFLFFRMATRYVKQASFVYLELT